MTKGARRVPTPFRYPFPDALIGLEPNRGSRRAQHRGEEKMMRLVSSKPLQGKGIGVHSLYVRPIAPGSLQPKARPDWLRAAFGGIA